MRRSPRHDRPFRSDSFSPKSLSSIARGCAALVCWALLGIRAPAAPDCVNDCRCPGSPDDYVGYKVKSISLETALSVKTPLSFLFPLQNRLQAEFNAIKSQLPLKEGCPFDRALYGLSLAELESRFVSAEVVPGERIRIRAIIPTLRNCLDKTRPGAAGTEDDKTVEVVYRVYTSEYLNYFSRVFESRPDQITRTLAPNKTADKLNKILPQPFIGYNGSRGWFGGTKMSFESEKGLFNRAEMDVSGAGGSATAGLSLSGSRTPNLGWLSYAEWRLAYRYANLPGEQIKLKEGTALGQFFGATQPLGQQNITLRFGASVEGGNRQTELPDAGLTSAAPSSPSGASALAQSSYRALKFYLGATVNRGRQGWTATYGLQAGSSGDGGVDFLKHIVDVGYSARFLWREHRPFRLDSRISAGVIQSAEGKIPIVEQFIGGNAQRDFIEGDSWRIRSNPVIRSFAQNLFGRISDGPGAGGKNFFSLNLTLAQTIWNRSAVPQAVLRDPDLPTRLGGGLRTAQTATLLSYLQDVADYRQSSHDLMAKIDELLDKLLQLKERLKALAKLRPPQEVLDAIGQFTDDESSGTNPFSDAGDCIAAAKEADQSPDPVKKSNIRTNVRTLVTDVGDEDAILTILLAKIKSLQEQLQTAGMADESKEFDPFVQDLNAMQSTLRQALANLDRFGKTDMSKFQAVREKLRDATRPDDAGRVLGRMNGLIQDLQTVGSDKLKNLIKPLAGYVNGAVNDIPVATGDPLILDPDAIRGALATLLIGFGKLSPPTFTLIVNEIEKLRPQFTAESPAEGADKVRALADEGKSLAALHGRMLKDLKVIVPTDPERKTRRDIDYAVQSLDVVFRELNLYAVSPILIFDVARLGPSKNSDFGGARYGLGAGVRFSLVSLDLNLGYAGNLNRRRGEGRGAFVFSLDVADLFR